MVLLPKHLCVFAGIHTGPVNLTLAHTFLNFSSITYCPSTIVSNWTCTVCENTAEV